MKEGERNNDSKLNDYLDVLDARIWMQILTNWSMSDINRNFLKISGFIASHFPSPWKLDLKRGFIEKEVL
jgi:hypothetical protein